MARPGVSPEKALALALPRRKTAIEDFLVRLVRQKPLGTVGAVFVLIACLLAILADVIAPYGYREQITTDVLQGPSLRHLLGTDALGRDLFSRIIYGARISLTVGFGALAISITGSTILGVLSGYLGGRFDTIVQRIVDAFLTFPWLVIVLTIMAILGPGILNVIIALGFISIFGNSRVIRGAVLSVKENMYVDAARAVGCGSMRIMSLYILPNVMAPIIIIATRGLAAFILAEASISFLGFGVPPPYPTWGGMLASSGLEYMVLAPGMAIWPGLALAVTVFGFNMLGDAMRDLLDPRLRGV